MAAADLTPVWVVVITSLAVSVVGPIVQAKQQRRAKDQDHAREDQVAARAAEVAEQLIAANKAVALTAHQTSVQVAETAAVTNGKLDQIHTLVNSNMTAAMQSEHDALVRVLVMTGELIMVRRAAGQEPSPETLAAQKATQEKIKELAANLADRFKQTERADFELRQATDDTAPLQPPSGYRRIEEDP